MYEETGVLFPHFQNFSQVQQLEEFCNIQKSNVSMSDLFQVSLTSEYDMIGESDLFKAPEPIVEEPIMELDPMMAAISLMSCDNNVISSEGLKVEDFESIQTDQLLNEVFYYECKKDLLEKDAIETPLSEILNIKIPDLSADESGISENKPFPDASLPKSVSSGNLSSMDCIQGPTPKLSFLDFPGIDFNAVYGMRRAFSEGDIKTLGSGNVSLAHSPFEPPLFISNCTSEERREKLSRYRNKKSKRNFGRKIKYACRKALADSQPRIRGRFAKTEELDTKSN